MLLGILNIFLNSLFSLLGMAYLVRKIKAKLGKYTYSNFQEIFIIKMKQIAGLILLGCFVFMLLSWGLRFLLFGLAHWLNDLLASTYMGFFIVSLCCFLAAAFMIWLLLHKIKNTASKREEVEKV